MSDKDLNVEFYGATGEHIAKITKAVMRADQVFKDVGGSSRHWVRECLLEELRDEGLEIIETAQITKLTERAEKAEAKVKQDTQPPKPCSTCGGSGRKNRGSKYAGHENWTEPCPDCEKGRQMCKRCNGHGELLGPQDERIPCPECQPKPSEDCPECGGDGLILDAKMSMGETIPCPQCKPDQEVE